MFPYLRMSSLFWHVFCFNESKKETLHQECPGFLAGWITYLFWEAARKAHAVIPPLDHAHTYHESTVHPPAHTQSRLFPKVLDLLHTHRSTATHTDTQTHAHTSCLCTSTWGPLRKEEAGSRLQPLKQFMSIWTGSRMNCSSLIALLLPHDSP